jgi:4-hydroxybenzoate polyprenyltransferase
MRGTSKLLAYAQLFRLPNVFTAIADIAAGYLFVRAQTHEPWQPWPNFALLVAASSLLYIAGMVLNDLFDLQQDRLERPSRPLPSGRIARGVASRLGWGMLLLGVALAWSAGYMRFAAADGSIALPWRAGVVATLLAAMIVAYDRWLKRTPLGPLAMGGCRFLNMLLGMSTASMLWCGGPAWALHYEAGQLLIAGGLGVYVAGITWFARTEAHQSKRLHLVAAVVVMVAGVAMIAGYAWLPEAKRHFPQGAGRAMGNMGVMWPLLIMLISLTIVRRSLMAAQRPIPARVQGAVKQAILSIILLDAAIAMLVGPLYSIAVLALLLPTLLLGRWVYST